MVVVNWNSGSDLEQAVAGLRAQRNVLLRILVVDNNSHDDSLARALLRFPDLEVIQTGANLGYTGGNNVGFAHSTMSGSVLVLNPDVTFEDPNVLARLVAALQKDNTLAAVAPIIVRTDGVPEYTETRLDPHLALVGKAVPPASTLPDVIPQKWLDGAIFLARAPVIADIGGFDERYFLFCDEVDLAIRLRAAGWTLGLVTSARVRHRRGSSFGKSRKGLYYYWRNLYLLCRLHAPGRVVWRGAWVARLVKNIIDPSHVSGPRAGPMLRGAADSLRGRYGPGPEDRDG